MTLAMSAHLHKYDVQGLLPVCTSLAINYELVNSCALSLVAQPHMCFDQDRLLVVAPRLSLYVRPQLVVPALPALFADAAREGSRDGAPLPLSLEFNEPVASAKRTPSTSLA